MKFMVTWQIDQDKWFDVLGVWSSMTPEQRVDAGDDAKIIGRWHNMAARSGVAIVEASNASALFRYLGQWNPHMDMEVSPVLDDEESVALSKATLGDHGV
jgi:hypothetical protein